MGTDKVLVKRKDGVAQITFNEPKRRNPLSLELMEETTAALKELASDPEIRVVTTTGAGDAAYLGGLDVKELATVWRDADSPEEIFLDFVYTLRNFPKVTIAVVNGYCLGGGVTILLAHDLAIASERAQIGLPEIFRGFTPRYATGALFKAISPRVAFEMLLTGKNLDAERAAAVGLLNRVVPHDRLRAEADTWAREVSRFDPVTVEFSKKAAYDCLDQPSYAQALKVSSRLHLEHNAANPKSFEGLLAFVEGKGEKANR
jgi:enoyl-CoA hydratase/carnithine racemase